ncbi:MAG: hypothetical protein ACREK1_12595, partial [Longimicrobiales bacterium]
MRTATPLLRVCCATLSLAVAAPGTLLSAQETPGRPDADVPGEFARVLLDLRSGGELLIGRMPDDVPGAAALAAGARVVGSVVYRDQSRTALAVPEHVAAAREEFDARLRTAGWTEREGAGRQERGFLPAYAEDRFRLFCWPATEAQLSMTVQRAPAGGSYV